MKDKKKISIHIWIAVLLLIIIVILMIVAVIRKDKHTAATEENRTGLTQSVAAMEKWQEGDVSYQGKKYRYNSSIKTYLFMGIDKEGTAEVAEDGISGGQSDAMFLLIADAKNQALSVVSIHRNTMTMVDVYDVNGTYVDSRELQICLQHAYGDGLRTSCLRAADAVSRLFYNIPISGYLSLNMDGIPILNDAVGGVTVEVMDDLTNEALGVSLKKGETVTLNGKEAYVYIRSRDIDEFDSAGRRLERQNQYLFQLFDKIQNTALASEASILRIHEQIKDYLVTSIDFVRLAEDIEEYGFDASHMYSVPGETIMGKRFEEYHVDEEAFYDMIINLFYEQVDES